MAVSTATANALLSMSKIMETVHTESRNLEEAINKRSNFKDAMAALKSVQQKFELPDPDVMLMIETEKKHFCGDFRCSACGDPTIRNLHIVKVMFPLGLALCIPNLPNEDQPSVFLRAKLSVHLETGSTCLEKNLEFCFYTPSGIEFSNFESDEPTVEMMQTSFNAALQQKIEWNAIHRPDSSLVSTFWENRRLIATLSEVSLTEITFDTIWEHFDD